MYTFYSYTDKNGVKTVVAVSTYAGKIVKGKAKCDPNDEYSEEKGRALAAARCNAKVAHKRFNRACAEFTKAVNEHRAAEARVFKMKDYYNDSMAALNVANEEIDNLLRDWD